VYILTSGIIVALCNNIKFRFYCYIFCTQTAVYAVRSQTVYIITYSMSVLYFSVANKVKRMTLMGNFKLFQHSISLDMGGITTHLTWNYYYQICFNNYLHLNTKKYINMNIKFFFGDGGWEWSMMVSHGKWLYGQKVAFKENTWNHTLSLHLRSWVFGYFHVVW
jgi:hypothetical protein